MSTYPGIKHICIRTSTEKWATIDNGADGCTGGPYGHCDHDLYVYFINKIGAGCSTRWLFNNARWKSGNDGKNAKNEAFDNAGWDCFNWNEVNCVSGNGFYVPNKVLY